MAAGRVGYSRIPGTLLGVRTYVAYLDVYVFLLLHTRTFASQAVREMEVHAVNSTARHADQ